MIALPSPVVQMGSVVFTLARLHLAQTRENSDHLVFRFSLNLKQIGESAEKLVENITKSKMK